MALNLFGPSTSPGAPQITPQAINDGVNAELILKVDANNPVVSSLPTSPAGLPVGALWRNGTFVCIV